jgi:thymidylate kinase
MRETRYGPLPELDDKPVKSTQRVIIFDSPDGTGKTNISYALSQRLGIPYFKMNTEHENWRKGKFKEALEFDQTYLLQFLKQTKYSVVIDRAYPAEWVYSQVFGRETNMELLRKLDEEFARIGTNIVIPVRDDYSKNRPDEVVDHEYLPKLHQKYMEFRDWTKCHTVTIYVDSYRENLKDQLDDITPELLFNGDMLLGTDVTLHRSVRNKFSDEDIKKAQAEQFANWTSSDHLKNRRWKNS